MPVGKQLIATINSSNRLNAGFVFYPCAVLVYAFLLALRKVDNFDIWWHLKVGETIFLTKKVPLTETFSHTMAGTIWIPHEWLSELFYYAAYALGGMTFVSIAAAMVVAIATGLLWLRGRDFQTNAWLLALVVVWVLLSARFRFMARPHVFLFALSGGLLLILERYAVTRNRLYGLLTVPWMILWVNTHGSFPLGIVFVGAWATDEIFRKNSRFPLLVFLLATICTLAHPGGPLLLQQMLDLFSATTLDPSINNEEFYPPGWSGHQFFWLFLGTTFFALLFTVRTRRPRVLEVVVLLATTVLALRGVRFIALFVFAVAPYTASRLDMLLIAFRARQNTSVHAGRLPALLISATVIFVMALGFVNSYGPTKAYRWGIGIDPRSVPTDAASFLKATDLSNIRLYNSKRLGGYLTWSLFPRFRVAQDGRDEVFQDFHTQLDVTTPTEYAALQTRYAFQIAVTGFVPENGFERFILEDPRWILVYWDDLTLVHAYRDAVPESFLVRFAYRYFSPLSLDYSYLRPIVEQGHGQDVVRELTRATQDNPESFKPWVYLGYVSMLLGHNVEAIPAYERALAINPELGIGHYGLAATLGTLYLAAKNPGAAVESFTRHFSKHPLSGDPLYWYANSLYLTHDLNRAETYLRSFLADNPTNDRALNDLGFLLYDTNRFEEANDAFRKALSINPESSALFGLALTVQKDQGCTSARPHWRRVAEAPQMDPGLRAQAATYLRTCGDHL